jgi:predicted regulator of Ras-like GTPase activity (Roadblock/LC7/MglB family)
MFDLVRTWLVQHRVRTLEAQLQGRSTPQLYLQLADAYREAGSPQRAVQILRLGSTRFPNSADLRRREQEAEKLERENEKRRLHDKLRSAPNPTFYARLADLYRTDGDIERTTQICEAGMKAFPRYGGTYLVLGQVCMEQEKWEEAKAQIEKAVELDKYNYLGLKLLAQIYMRLGKPAEAAKQLEQILYFAPADEATKEALKKAQEAAGTAKVTETAVAAPRGPVEAPRPAAAPERRRLTGLIGAAATASPREQTLSDGIERLSRVEGVQGALLVDQYGLVVAASLDPALDESLVGALVTNIFRTASGEAPRLSAGVFEEAVIEAERTNLHVAQCGEMILAVLASPGVRPGMLEKNVREFTRAVLEPPGK